MNAPTQKRQQPLYGQRSQTLSALPCASPIPFFQPEEMNVPSGRSSSDTLRRLGLAAAYKDDGTAAHMARTGALSAFLASKIGLDSDKVRLIRVAAPMHDVGKIGIPDSILLKPGALSAEEFEIMKTHTLIGAAILQDSEDELLMVAHTIALCHHERWDGSGYPRGMSGESVPLVGRLVGLVDAFDAMCSHRPYRRALMVSDACETIRSQRGKQFDPYLADTLLSHLPAVLEIREIMNARAGTDDLPYACARGRERGLRVDPSLCADECQPHS
jgi:putative two-component system response regulator